MDDDGETSAERWPRTGFSKHDDLPTDGIVTPDKGVHHVVWQIDIATGCSSAFGDGLGADIDHRWIALIIYMCESHPLFFVPKLTIEEVNCYYHLTFT